VVLASTVYFAALSNRKSILPEIYSLHLNLHAFYSKKEFSMPKYLVQANYVGEGVKGLLKDGGTTRKAVVEKFFKSLGGSLEAFYYAFGDTDLYVIADFPDDASAAAASLMVASTGTVTAKITVLLTPEQVDAAAKKSPVYSPPGH
jgi:uncharacterized protein with GYD domain